MDTFSKIIQERFPLLPQEIQKYLTDPSFTADTGAVATENGLNDEQKDGMTIEILLVFFGVENPINFMRNIKESLGLDPEKTRKIAQTVNEKIFQKFKDFLNALFAGAEGGTQEDTAQGASKQAVAIGTTPDHQPEIRDDHILPEEPHEELLMSGHEQQEERRSPTPTPQPTPTTSIPRPERSPFSTSSKPIEPPPPPAPPIQTLQGDIKQQSEAQSIAEQKLNKIVSLPKQEKKFEIPDPKNRTSDPYREPLE